jgi:hypothetical protein
VYRDPVLREVWGGREEERKKGKEREREREKND